MGGDRRYALRQEVVERGGPGDEVEEVSGAGDVVGTGAEIAPQTMFALSVEVKLGAVGRASQ